MLLNFRRKKPDFAAIGLTLKHNARSDDAADIFFFSLHIPLHVVMLLHIYEALRKFKHKILLRLS